MNSKQRWLLVWVVAAAFGATAGLGAEPKPESPKKALVELYTSQGCDMCPAADELLARLGALGYGPDRIITLSFHVDYFNDPWKDPFSDAAYSQREMAYNTALNRKDLYFTPMMMIDGRHPMLGSDQARAQSALKDVLKERPGVLLAIDLVKGPEDADSQDAQGDRHQGGGRGGGARLAGRGCNLRESHDHDGPFGRERGQNARRTQHCPHVRPPESAARPVASERPELPPRPPGRRQGRALRGSRVRPGLAQGERSPGRRRFLGGRFRSGLGRRGYEGTQSPPAPPGTVSNREVRGGVRHRRGR